MSYWTVGSVVSSSASVSSSVVVYSWVVEVGDVVVYVVMTGYVSYYSRGSSEMS